MYWQFEGEVLYCTVNIFYKYCYPKYVLYLYICTQCILQYTLVYLDEKSSFQPLGVHPDTLLLRLHSLVQIPEFTHCASTFVLLQCAAALFCDFKKRALCCGSGIFS